jgi:type I restriction enzyme, S subunit
LSYRFKRLSNWQGEQRLGRSLTTYKAAHYQPTNQNSTGDEGAKGDIEMTVSQAFPGTWQLARCQDIVDVRDGTHDTPAKVTSGIPLVTSKNLKPEGIDFSDVTYISEADHEQIEKRSGVDDGDILFAMIGTIGNPVIVRKTRPFSIKNVALFKFGTAQVLPEYFKRLLSSQFVAEQLNRATRGGNQKFVSLQVLRNLIIPLPPIAEQKRIAAILDKADELRGLRRKALKELDAIAQSIFLEMFGDSIVNSKGWEVRSMDDCAERIQIGPFGTQLHEEDYINDGIPLINPMHIQDGRIVPNSSFSVSPEKHQQLSQYHLEVDDVILARRGEMGRCAVISEVEAGWLCGTGSLFVRPKRNLLKPTYLFFLLSSQSTKKYLENASQGVTMANLNKTIISQIPVALPSISLQQEFARRVEAIEQLKATHRESLAQLDALFASLQHRAFRGEL